MTTHELARLLLAAPDRQAVVNDDTEGVVHFITAAYQLSEDDVEYIQAGHLIYENTDPYAVGDVIIAIEA